MNTRWLAFLGALGVIVAIGVVVCTQLIETRPPRRTFQPPSTPPVALREATTAHDPGAAEDEIDEENFDWNSLEWPQEESGAPQRSLDAPQGLTKEEEASLATALKEAQETPSHALIASLTETLGGANPRQMWFRAQLLGWALAQDTRRLDDLERAIRDPQTIQELKWALYLIIGQTQTPECTERLLRLLDDPLLKADEVSILKALHQAKVIHLLGIQLGYSGLLHNDKAWALGLTACYDRTFDPNIVRATLARMGAPYSLEVQRTAARMLDAHSSPGTREKLAPDLMASLRERFWSLRDSADRGLHDSARTFLPEINDPEVHSWVWSEYEGAATGSRERKTFARAVARQANSLADVSRLLDSAKREPNWYDREILAGFSLDFAQTPTDRSAVAQQLVAYAASESEATVRERIVHRLGRLLPDSAEHLQWALQDPSEKVRSVAEKLLR